MKQAFTRFAQGCATAAGSPWAFSAALGIVLVWLLTGPIFGFSDTWQLVINTGTTIITFLMVFLIQNAQNRDTAALQLKLDEIIRQLPGSNRIINAEDLPEEQLEQLLNYYQSLAKGTHHAPHRDPTRRPDGR